MANWKDAVAEHMGGSKDKPKKEIKEFRISKSHNGGHVIVHEHHHPEHHPNETHTTKGDDELVEHMMKHAGTPNPGEQEADPTGGAADPSAAPAQMTAAPSPMGSGAPGAAAPAAAAGV